MALMDLSPWPTDGDASHRAARQLAESVRGAALTSGGRENEDRAIALGMAASAMVERYAPNAPQILKNEAVIRFAGYLAQSDFGSIVQEDLGPQSVTYPTNHAAMFRNSGAAGLLTRWL